MRLAFGVWLFSRVLLACALQFREPDMDPPPTDPVKHSLQGNTAAAKISALKVKSLYAANTAQASAAEASVQKMEAEEIYAKTMEAMPELKSIQKYAESQAESAKEASKESQNALKSMKSMAKKVKEESQALAVITVKKLLRDKYDELSDWRHKVLANPWEKSQWARAQAGAPYHQMAGKFGASIAAYELEAKNMRAQAAADAANAESMASGVKAKMEAGDQVAALQDREMAKALEKQSSELAWRANKLDGQAESMKKVMPVYSAQAGAAALSAEYAANPDSVPPPPLDPNMAFTPPPLAEEKKE